MNLVEVLLEGGQGGTVAGGGCVEREGCLCAGEDGGVGEKFFGVVGCVEGGEIGNEGVALICAVIVALMYIL